MYILLLEDNAILSAADISDDELLSADNGCIVIIDIQNPLMPMRYIDGEWEEMANIDDTHRV